MAIEKYILDPLSVIVKLAILSKKSIGCKIGINNNIIYIQDVGMFQSFVRLIFKNNKTDIQYLYNPIELACKHYLSKEYVKIYPNIKNLFLNAIKGLEKLKLTYNHNIMITHTLYLYCSIINNYLGDIFNKNLFINDNITEEYSTDIKTLFINTWVNINKSENKQISKIQQIENTLPIQSLTPTQTQTPTPTPTKINKKLNQNEEENIIKQNKKTESPEESNTNLKIEERIKIILNLIDFIDKDSEFDKSVKCLEEFMTIIDEEIKTQIDKINLEELNKELEKRMCLDNIIENK